MGRKVDVDDLVSATEITNRLGLHRNMIHTWLHRYPNFPRPVAALAIGHVWSWAEVERWATGTGRGQWDILRSGLAAEELVPLRTWAADHEVPAAALVDLAHEGHLPLAKRGGRFYLHPRMAEAAWSEHCDRIWRSTSSCRLARRPSAPSNARSLRCGHAR